MKELWNSRYSQEEYIYGKQPNQFFKQEILKLSKGKLLLPADGEGRNAVFASLQGWEVDAFDFSKEARQKALKLAVEVGTSINYVVSTFEDFEAPENYYDCIALTYVHVPVEKRKETHINLVKLLKPGGILILEGFSKAQLDLGTGGPKNIDMLFSKDELFSDFSELNIKYFNELEIKLSEGNYHNGISSVVQLVAIK